MKIRKRVCASGRVAWTLDLGKVEGRRRQRLYATKGEAQSAMEEEMERRERHGRLATELQPAELAELVAARDRVEAAGGTISGAVEFWLQHAQRVRKALTTRKMLDGFVHARDKAGCSARYLRQLEVCLGSFVRAVPGLAHEVTREQVMRWLNGNGWAAKTRNNYLGDLRALFAWGLMEGYVAKSPVEGISKAREAEGEIGTLTLAECEALLRAVLPRPDLAGYVVIGLFAGVRPAELEKLDWLQVDAAAGTVIVLGATAKSRRRRVVDLSANALDWLRAAYPDGVPTQGALCGPGFEERWMRFRAKLGYATAKTKGKPWPHNAMRHTFASYHYAQHANEAKLQALMGHRSADMLHRHYRALKTAAEAGKFWEMRPGQVES